MAVTRIATIPLTTIFTPPSYCSSHWTFEQKYYNSVEGGLLLQNALAGSLDVPCFPTGFRNQGRVAVPQIYSPGVCPSGYSGAVTTPGSETTTVICCQSGFSYYNTITTVNFFASTSILFEGCLRTFRSGATSSVLARTANTDLGSTEVTGPITMWGQPITVQYQSGDQTAFFTTTSSSSLPRSTSMTIATAPSQTSSSQPLPTSPTAPATGISLGAKVGIGAGIALLALIIVGLAAFFLWRKRKAKTIFPTYGSDDGYKQELRTVPLEMEAVDQKGYKYVDGTRQAPAELGV